MKKLLVFCFILLGCGDDKPKTMATLQDKPIMNVKSLNETDKSLLYQDIFQQKSDELKGATLAQFSACLDDKIGSESGFAILSVMINRCVETYQHQPKKYL